MRYLFALIIVIIGSSFAVPAPKNVTSNLVVHTFNDSTQLAHKADLEASQFVEFAKTQIGKRYVWGSVNPKVGFDCSGFVNYVSQQFGIKVPRTSAQFTKLGLEVEQSEAKAGDIILFTGSNARKKKVGHMGIVTANDSTLEFIHSSSGGRKGVHISELKGYYKIRLVKIIRIFPLNENREVG